MAKCVIVVGLGEIGRPLMRILGRRFETVGVDLAPAEVHQSCSVLHICYPFQIPDFVGETIRYIRTYQPGLTVINSTVAPGTTRGVYEKSGRAPIAYSPVRGKHVNMEQDLLRYQKFVAGCDSRSNEMAIEHFEAAGMRTARFNSPEIGEVSKLLETTWLGILVGWAQEVERIARRFGATFEDANAYIREVDFLPSHIFPGFIGGHCVMPNIEILRDVLESNFLTSIVESNQAKLRELKEIAGPTQRAAAMGRNQ